MTVTWWTASGIILYHRSIAYELFLYCSSPMYFFRCYCYHHYKTQKYYFCFRYFCYRYHYYHITLLLNTLLQILSYPGVVELTTQLLILENILWLPLCRINKFGLNTLPSKAVAIPYTCGLSSAWRYIFRSCNSIVTYYVLWSNNPEVTIIGLLLGDDHSLRSSCIHYVLMLRSGSLLKGGLNIP